MEIKRFFAAGDPNMGYLLVEGEEFRHLSKVLRYKAGYKAIACTGDGFDYLCRIESIEVGRAVLKIEEKQKCAGDPPFELTLYQALPKGAKADFIVQKAVELGAGKIVFFSSQYSAEEKFNSERLSRIAVEACKQCGRSAAAEIAFLESFDKVLESREGKTLIMPYERESEGRLKDALAGEDGSVDLIVGSEGGFSEEEAEKARAAGAKLVTLGKRILRCETAALVSLALVMYERGELGG